MTTQAALVIFRELAVVVGNMMKSEGRRLDAAVQLKLKLKLVEFDNALHRGGALLGVSSHPSSSGVDDDPGFNFSGAVPLIDRIAGREYTGKHCRPPQIDSCRRHRPLEATR